MPMNDRAEITYMTSNIEVPFHFASIRLLALFDQQINICIIILSLTMKTDTSDRYCVAFCAICLMRKNKKNSSVTDLKTYL